jgi:hypothetical protein
VFFRGNACQLLLAKALSSANWHAIREVVRLFEAVSRAVLTRPQKARQPKKVVKRQTTKKGFLSDGRHFRSTTQAHLLGHFIFQTR